MNVLVVGSGGREHALAWKIAQSPELEALHAAPGNPGIAELARCHPVAAEDGEALFTLCRELAIDLVVFGPEAPLVYGVGEGLRRAGVPVFGPSAAAARIEGSKSFAKEVLRAAGVPTARELAEPRAPCVVKADGLAAGKGVFVCLTQPEAEEAWQRARAFGGGVVVEELLEGEEVSLFALADGREAVALPAAQDYKRLRDGDEGPNTGGMGAYSPVPALSDGETGALVERIHGPVLAELERRGAPFTGLLYAGLMLTGAGPRVLEFNCRFGDPETQAVLPRLAGDLLPALYGAATRALETTDVAVEDEAAVTVVLAAAGYPESPERGEKIVGVEAAERGGALVFHAGTALRGDALVAQGGRVLNVTATGETVGEARARAYRCLDLIELRGGQVRRDIGAHGVGGAFESDSEVAHVAG